MLSHLRFHRRGPSTSTPTSPVPDQIASWEAGAPHEPSPSQAAAARDARDTRDALDVSPRPLDARPRSSNARMPPTLPPIARVTSTESEPSFDLGDGSGGGSEHPMAAAAVLVSRDSSVPPPTLARPRQNEGGNSSFIGGVALDNYRRSVQGMPPRPESPGNVDGRQHSRTKPMPPPINTNLATRPPGSSFTTRQSKAMSFVTPTDLQQNFMGPTGKRPAGMRLGNETGGQMGSSAAPEAHRGKKGLPFLKNPMSNLLMRRRTGQNMGDTVTVSLDDEPSYDPRIRGTRVHDFSAPRPRRVMTTSNDANPNILPKAASYSDLGKSLYGGDSTSSVQYPTQIAAAKGRPTERRPDLQFASIDTRIDLDPVVKQEKRVSVDKPLPDQPPMDFSKRIGTPSPPIVLKDDAASAKLHRSYQSSTTRTMSVDTSILRSTSSVRTATSRTMSMMSKASTKESISVLPKHMKSTSSRFSFDMIGAAKQEKLLEERHRQREMEKKTTDEDQGRGSRFDDYDEQDFDYDAMMDDDGLEERIPGVNADYDEEEEINEGYGEIDYTDAMDDPNNDQENFAGFVFQRSDPASSMISPQTQTTGPVLAPRDLNINPVETATADETTIAPLDMKPGPSSINTMDTIAEQTLVEEMTGLGIQGLDPKSELSPASAAMPPQVPTRHDDLYFDDGLADELDFEQNGNRFDESLFDIEDTDKYGRPIPGLFAQAQKEHAARQEASRRESDMTSKLSPSTAHTSLSLEAQLPAITSPVKQIEDPAAPAMQDAVETELPTHISGSDFAYQAALAEAAQKAAALGKFRRVSTSSPSVDGPGASSSADLADSSLLHTQPPEESPLDDSLDNYEDDPFSNDLDDFDFDDEAIIAEANASALANDSEGFYGQEFGFYSAPMSQPHYGHGHHGSSSVSSSASGLGSASGNPSNPLSAEALYQYANGGFFGPSGQALGYSASGRLASREPNLTPITERSEYSNRNSVMSLALPPAIGSGAGTNDARNSLTSPGLAQLAMMADDDNMSLSALLKLRSKAWGGSQASPASSRDGSPQSDRGVGSAGAGAGGAGSSSATGGLDSASSPWSAGAGLGVGVGAGASSSASAGVAVGHRYGHGRKNSSFSVWSNSEAGSRSGSPTLTPGVPLSLPPATSPTAVPVPVPPPLVPAAMNLASMPPPPPPQQQQQPAVAFLAPAPTLQQQQQQQQQQQASAGASSMSTPCPPVPEDEQMIVSEESAPASASASAEGYSSLSGSGVLYVNSPTTLVELADTSIPPSSSSSSRRPGMGHRHKGSADSISYTKEEDSGETRWVVERRRTAESGEVEILGREVVEGRRI